MLAITMFTTMNMFIKMNNLKLYGMAKHELPPQRFGTSARTIIREKKT